MFRNVYLYGGTNVFQCAGNRLPHEVFQRRFNFAYGWNIYGLDGLLIKRDSAVSPYAKMGSVISPSDCVVLGDLQGGSFLPLLFLLLALPFAILSLLLIL